MRSQAAKPYSKIVAVLGPTNTGKTHRAISRMLEHPSGMIGLPLRLLAREVYDRLTRELGEGAVALVTGEEKRIGSRARYWVCTVEAMPPRHEVDFVAIDEIQLAAHPRRGHVFTDRLMHARGRAETWLLGAETMRPLLRALVPTASFESQPRFSTLRARGQTRLGGLPPRSAVVAFNVPEVYRLAERLRHRRGGAAVVLGALSPRARNAQVALYESGEVDYLVATDAIGMGLNLGIGHVAFASVHKFDGRDERVLEPAELAQIAGRAGRYLENGTFGTLAPLPALHESVVRRIEEHRFENVQALTWRNSDLCTDSTAELLASLEVAPKRKYLNRLAVGSDLEALQRLAEDAEVKQRAHGEAAVALLWQTCQIPDYRQWIPELHAALVKQIFMQLTGPKGALDPDWLESSIQPLEDQSGDIDSLTARIASVRTWTYLSSHSAWIPDAEHWRERTRDLEDRLSDVLHERLVERFVARRRHSVQLGSPVSGGTQAKASRRAGQDSPFSALEGLRNQLFDRPAPSLERWVEDLVAAPHERFHLDADGHVFDADRQLAQLVHGKSLLTPEIKVSLAELDSGQLLRLSRRLLGWSRDVVHDVVSVLRETPASPWSAAGRGLIYQLEQNLGSIPTQHAKQQLSELTASDRASLAVLRIQLGREVIYAESSLQPRQRLARLALAQAFAPHDIRAWPSLSSRVSFRAPHGLDTVWLNHVGFVLLGTRAVRADIAERVSKELWVCSKSGSFTPPVQAAQWLGCSTAELGEVTVSLGYRRGEDGHYRALRRQRRRRGKHPLGTT